MNRAIRIPSADADPGAPSAGYTWSLQRRLFWWFLGISMVLQAALFGVSVFFVGRATNSELDALVHEELDEFKTLLQTTDGSPEALEGIARQLVGNHDELPMRFEIWSADGSRRDGAFGTELDVGPGWGPPALLNQTFRVGGARRVRATGLRDGRQAVLLLEGQRVAAGLQYYQVSAAGIGVLALILSMLSAHFFGQRMNRMLARLTRGLEVTRLTTGPLELDLGNPPLEIAPLVEALTELSHRAHADIARGRVLIAGLAHELRAPIAAMLGDLDVTLRKPRESQEYQALLVRQREELFELGDSVDNLVAHCRSGQVELRGVSESFDLGREAGFRLERACRSALVGGVEVEISSDGDLTVTGDREDLLRALRNLVQNAIQWSPPGGRVQVQLHGDRSGIHWQVRDQGPGIPVEDRPTIFEPFNRGRQRQGQRQGYGLGLTIARDAVVRQGGRIEIEDPEGGGTCMQVWLPRTPQPGPPGTDRADRASQAPGSIHPALIAG